MLRRQRNADAGVGGDLVAETFIGRADRLENPGDEVGDFGCVLDRGLNDGEFVAAEPRDEIIAADAPAQAHRHRFQQFVADQMAKRIVDALEFVDVDIEHRQLLARAIARQLLFEPLVEQRAVRQVGQRIVMRQMGDPLLGALALGDVLDGSPPIRRPPAAG